MSVNAYVYAHIYMCVHVSVHVYLNVDNSVGAFGRQRCWILLKLVTGGSNLLHVLAGNHTQVLWKSSFPLDLNCIIFFRTVVVTHECSLSFRKAETGGSSI